MHPVAETVINEIDPDVYESVARATIGDSSATVVGTPIWTEISAAHNDLRTLAILKVEGRATGGAGELAWSSVQKLIDTGAEGGAAVIGGWVDPAKEEAVYEHGLFTNDGLNLRPARCYQISSPKPKLKMFWLEDLTAADATPFTVSQLESLVHDVGEFGGFHASNPRSLSFEPSVDSYLIRWKGAGFTERLGQMEDIQDRPEFRRIFGNISLQTAHDLHIALDQLADLSQSLLHSLSFGDCNPGNLFRLKDETVAIDWASLTIDPIGVDAGCLIGASMVWGKQGAEVAANERKLFDAYVQGLINGGWSGDAKDVRRAYFGQFGFYLMAACNVMTFASSGSLENVAHMRDFLEKRFQTPFDEIPDLLSPIVDSYPHYIDEISKLLES